MNTATLHRPIAPVAKDHLVTPRGQGPSKVEHHGWQLVDEPGVCIELSKMELHIDPSYQRTEDFDQRANRIAANWSWVALGVLIIAEREHTYFVVDGQTRLAAALKRSDIDLLPCIVFKGMTQKKEASGFIRINTGRKNVMLYDKWRAGLVAQDAEIQAMVALIEASGYQISRAPAAGGPIIRCLGTFQTCYRLDHLAMRELWPALCNAYDGQCIDERVLAGSFYLFRNAANKASKEALKAGLKRVGVEKLRLAATKASMVYSRGGHKVWALAMLDELNKRINKKNQIVLDTAGE